MELLRAIVNYETRDPLIRSCLLTNISTLFPFVKHQPHFLPQVLFKVRYIMTCVEECVLTYQMFANNIKRDNKCHDFAPMPALTCHLFPDVVHMQILLSLACLSVCLGTGVVVYVNTFQLSYLRLQHKTSPTILIYPLSEGCQKTESRVVCMHPKVRQRLFVFMFLLWPDKPNFSDQSDNFHLLWCPSSCD